MPTLYTDHGLDYAILRSEDDRYSVTISDYTPVVEDAEGGVWRFTGRAAERVERLAETRPEAALELALRLALRHSPLGRWQA